MSEEKKDLLPCPFCGSSAMLEELGDHHGAYHNLGCSKRECPAHHAIYTESEAPVEDSVNWWNTRASLQESEAGPATAKQKYDECMSGNQELSAIERLRFFCSLAMNGQDWLDVESFFDDLATPQYAQAIETAAIMKCVEIADTWVDVPGQSGQRAKFFHEIRDEIIALIPQDGRTQLEEFGMKVAETASSSAWKVAQLKMLRDMGSDEAYRNELRAIVTNLIGEKK